MLFFFFLFLIASNLYFRLCYRFVVVFSVLSLFFCFQKSFQYIWYGKLRKNLVPQPSTKNRRPTVPTIPKDYLKIFKFKKKIDSLFSIKNNTRFLFFRLAEFFFLFSRSRRPATWYRNFFFISHDLYQVVFWFYLCLHLILIYR